MKYTFEQNRNWELFLLDVEVLLERNKLVENLFLVVFKPILTVFYHPHINLA